MCVCCGVSLQCHIQRVTGNTHYDRGNQGCVKLIHCSTRLGEFPAMPAARELSFVCFVSVVLFLFLSLASASQIPIASHSYSHGSSSPIWSIASFTRSIDLGGATAKSSCAYTLQRRRDGTEFIVAVNEEEINAPSGQTSAQRGQLSWMDATIGKTGATKKAVPIRALGHDQKRSVCESLAAFPNSSLPRT